MITCEQALLWLKVFLIVGSAIMFGITFLIARHYGFRFRRRKDGRVKEEMLMAERMRVKQETEQVTVRQAGG